MYPSSDARQLVVLLRIARTMDIVGDVSVTVDNPSELLAWADLLTEPTVLAWRAGASGKRFVHVAAHHQRAPVHGRVVAVLRGDDHPEFFRLLLNGADLEPGSEQALDRIQLTRAWDALPITPPDP